MRVWWETSELCIPLWTDEGIKKRIKHQFEFVIVFIYFVWDYFYLKKDFCVLLEFFLVKNIYHITNCFFKKEVVMLFSNHCHRFIDNLSRRWWAWFIFVHYMKRLNVIENIPNLGILLKVILPIEVIVCRHLFLQNIENLLIDGCNLLFFQVI